MILTFEVPGKPQGKGRARHFSKKTKSGKVFSGTYTPDETVIYENKFAYAARDALKNSERQGAMFEGAIKVACYAIFPIPGTWSKKKQAQAMIGGIRPTSKPDWDNIGKLFDACNGILFADDKQIAEGTVIKLYGAEPKLIVEVSEL